MVDNMKSSRNRIAQLEKTVSTIMDSFEGIDDALEVVRTQVVKIKNWRSDIEDKIKTCQEELTELKTVDLTEMISIGIQSEYYIEPTQLTGLSSVCVNEPIPIPLSAIPTPVSISIEPQSSSSSNGYSASETTSDIPAHLGIEQPMQQDSPRPPILEKQMPYETDDTDFTDDDEYAQSSRVGGEGYSPTRPNQHRFSKKKTTDMQEKLIAANAMLAPVGPQEGKYNFKKYRCVFCDMILSQRGNGRRHIFKCHFNVRMTCNQCNQNYYDEVEDDDPVCFYCQTPNDIKIKMKVPRDHHGRRLSLAGSETGSVPGTPSRSRSGHTSPARSPTRNWKQSSFERRPRDIVPSSPISETKIKNAVSRLGKASRRSSTSEDSEIKPPVLRPIRRRLSIETIELLNNDNEMVEADNKPDLTVNNIPYDFDLKKAESATVVLQVVDPMKFPEYRRSQKRAEAATVPKSPVKTPKKKAGPKSKTSKKTHKANSAKVANGNSTKKKGRSSTESRSAGSTPVTAKRIASGPERKRKRPDSDLDNGDSNGVVYASKSDKSKRNPFLDMFGGVLPHEDNDFAASTSTSAAQEGEQYQPNLDWKFNCPNCNSRFENESEFAIHEMSCDVKEDPQTLTLVQAEGNEEEQPAQTAVIFTTSLPGQDSDGIAVYQDYATVAPVTTGIASEFFEGYATPTSSQTYGSPTQSGSYVTTQLTGSPFSNYTYTSASQLGVYSSPVNGNGTEVVYVNGLSPESRPPTAYGWAATTFASTPPSAQ